MAYAKRYAGGFVDKPTLTTPIDSAFLNAVETALLELLSTDGSADGQVLQWINASSKFGPALLLNKNVDPAAAIDKSKLNLAGAITDTDISGAAAIARSKLNFGSGLVNADFAAAAAIALSKLAGYPADAAKFARGDGTWASASSIVARKTTVKAATNTVADIDLLNAEFAVPANALGTNGVARVTAWGDWLQNGSGALGVPRFKLKLGAGPTTVIDTGATSGDIRVSATRYGWKIVCEVMNLAATNVQLVNFEMRLSYNYGVGSAITPAAFVTGEGMISAYGVGPSIAIAEAYNSAAIDTTALMNFVLSVINPSASATSETKLIGAFLEVL